MFSHLFSEHESCDHSFISVFISAFKNIPVVKVGKLVVTTVIRTNYAQLKIDKLKVKLSMLNCLYNWVRVTDNLFDLYLVVEQT